MLDYFIILLYIASWWNQGVNVAPYLQSPETANASGLAWWNGRSYKMKRPTWSLVTNCHCSRRVTISNAPFRLVPYLWGTLGSQQFDLCDNFTKYKRIKKDSEWWSQNQKAIARVRFFQNNHQKKNTRKICVSSVSFACRDILRGHPKGIRYVTP